MTIGTGFLLGTSVLAVALRLLSRRIQGLRLAWNDYTIVFALVTAVAMCAMSFYGIAWGMGRHVITVGLVNGEKVAQSFYITEVLFPVTNSAVKISILLLYNAIFSGVRNSSFTIALRTIGALWLLLAVMGTVCMVFQCWPIPLAWTSDHTMQCLDLEKMIYSLTIFSVFLNAATLILPLPLVWKLHLPHKRKLGVILLFILGGADLVVSIIRTLETKTIDATKADVTWIQCESTMLGLLEPCIAIVCACIPTQRPIFKKFFDCLPSVSQSRTPPPQMGQSAWTVPFLMLLTSRGSTWESSSSSGLTKSTIAEKEWTPLPRYSNLSPRPAEGELSQTEGEDYFQQPGTTVVALADRNTTTSSRFNPLSGHVTGQSGSLYSMKLGNRDLSNTIIPPIDHPTKPARVKKMSKNIAKPTTGLNATIIGRPTNFRTLADFNDIQVPKYVQEPLMRPEKARMGSPRTVDISSAVNASARRERRPEASDLHSIPRFSGRYLHEKPLPTPPQRSDGLRIAYGSQSKCTTG